MSIKSFFNGLFKSEPEEVKKNDINAEGEETGKKLEEAQDPTNGTPKDNYTEQGVGHVPVPGSGSTSTSGSTVKK